MENKVEKSNRGVKKAVKGEGTLRWKGTWFLTGSSFFPLPTLVWEHCRWMSSHPLYSRSSTSIWRHSSSTNHFL